MVMLFSWIRYVCVHLKYIQKLITDEVFNFKPRTNEKNAPAVIKRTVVDILVNPVTRDDGQIRFYIIFVRLIYSPLPVHF